MKCCKGWGLRLECRAAPDSRLASRVCVCVYACVCVRVFTSICVYLYGIGRFSEAQAAIIIEQVRK